MGTCNPNRLWHHELRLPKEQSPNCLPIGNEVGDGLSTHVPHQNTHVGGGAMGCVVVNFGIIDQFS
jgi:hypothetical protein